ncbi:unnamed protein product [Soboliphyme baturini]|uniref:Uncharacterized protein n=1 Tax=Soboliphyme baturini TaxID=241478 RepID=A0A183JA91_9BILA|nr:unnamed protein product [Soboliphyme baturini]
MLHFKAGLFVECTSSDRQFSDRLPIGAPEAGQCQSVEHRGASKYYVFVLMTNYSCVPMLHMNPV